MSRLLRTSAAIALIGTVLAFGSVAGASGPLRLVVEPADEEQVWSIWQGNARVKR